MNREFLKALGLEDEVIDKIMAEHGKTLNDTKNKLDTVTTERDDLQGQLIDRDEQLDALKDVDPDKLKQEIADLQQVNQTTKDDYEQKLHQQAFEHRLENTLKDAGVRNSKAVKALLDTDNIKLDGETLLGLDDQLKGLKESDPYLFEQEPQNEPKPNFTNGIHSKGSGALTKEQIMQETDNSKRQQLIRENSHLFK